jgi:hypothetical protein
VATILARLDCHQAAGFALCGTPKDFTRPRFDATNVLTLTGHFPLGEVWQLARVPADLHSKPKALVV